MDLEQQGWRVGAGKHREGWGTPSLPPGPAAWLEATEEHGRSLLTPFPALPSVGTPQASVGTPYFRVPWGLFREM